ncbi:MAG: hypothetical protein K8R21_07615 [Leptospira sp.]|nr:hypothetical protein [Leptospira sp.]
MQTKSKDTRLFFELRNILKAKVEETEKEIFSLNKKLGEIFSVIEKMNRLATEHKSAYFRLKLGKLKTLFKEFQEKKGYDKREFDSLFNSINKIKNTESIEFLDETLKNRIARAASTITPRESVKSKMENKNLFFTFRFNNVHFITENSPKRIIRNVERKKRKIKIEGRIYPIYPGKDFGLDEEDRFPIDSTNLLILKTAGNYRCFFIDQPGEVIGLNPDTFRNKLKKTEIPLKGINQYLKWKGTRYYYIPN